ncbi:MAG TPA: tetratricopeptide repeat protein, partial [Bacteroidia bacterium]|nr:tetratricopeptide repeat protein [Bacteroidia bacterium]
MLALGAVASHGQDEEETVESLYQKAAGFIGEERYEEASKAFERIFEISKGVERLFEDYGAQAGGLLFDYGLTLLPQQRWEEARKAFEDCVNAAKTAVDIQTPIKSTNTRENLAKYQLGYCEAQLGRHEEAIRLYDEYLAGKPSPEEVAQVRASFKLRYGTSLAKLGRIDEGVATIQELFDNYKAWNATPQFLMQGLLELGLVYVEQANAAGGDSAAIDRIEDKADEFLERNGHLIRLDPLAQYRLGFFDRLRKLGFESAKAGLYSLSLRFFSYVPTIEDIRSDLYLTLARQPVGTKMPAHFQTILDELAEREKAPVHPDAETLRLIATCYERLGNYHAPRVIYWYLADQYPEVGKTVRGEILHEASRLSSMVADYPAAQYFGEKFEAEVSGESALQNNVATFMLQSLFTSRAYDQVIATSEKVREQFPAGAPERELADALYPMALYSLQKYAEAEEPFSEYVKTQPEGSNREMVLYHRASNSLVLGKMREAAEQFEDFLKAYPESERFLDG